MSMGSRAISLAKVCRCEGLMYTIESCKSSFFYTTNCIQPVFVMIFELDS